MPFHSTTIFTLAHLLPLLLAHLPQQKYHSNLLPSITIASLTHTLASLWRKQSCLILHLNFHLTHMFVTTITSPPPLQIRHMSVVAPQITDNWTYLFNKFFPHKRTIMRNVHPCNDVTWHVYINHWLHHSLEIKTHGIRRPTFSSSFGMAPFCRWDIAANPTDLTTYDGKSFMHRSSLFCDY